MQKQDWLFNKDNFTCSFRTVGILMRDGKILVQRDKDGTEYALPGGHVIIGESSDKSLIREYKEETGADVKIHRLAWVEEYFWDYNRTKRHSLAFYYLISLENNADIPDTGEFFSQKDNCNIVFTWLSLKELKNITIYPLFLKDKIGCISDGIEYFKVKY
ncbi:NUDIX hydrolase [Clostridium polynesiense]|uniref:NUDIX hydrolase n=1 Tax=Clostridium polynesiense TaxID=1325933 RepID=UPI00058B3A60|nr:NUDIX hydrolase [Clostridium polynesiense]